MQSKAIPPEKAPLLFLTDKELAAISGGCSSSSSNSNSSYGPLVPGQDQGF
jgi:bacteriocin-like protein